ncbi:energy transducer TonB [Pseudoalteromonas sp. MMG022]|uniref:energy transducer TonB n=1 Tax=Pseudoalteromonas sp. MMG022 TaxID=2909978 RepID=UPI001F02D4C2|nr:energy transducer TonB [Pseudoalteromonas sp. MMG022]MCF6437645.1 TonB family protein [Pseudoalteromonas sp. MMG022]
MQAIEYQQNNMNYTKLASAIAGGALMTGAAFVFMHSLIAQDNIRVPQATPTEIVELPQLKEDTPVQEIEKLPEPPKMQPPPVRSVAEPSSEPTLTTGIPFAPEVSTTQIKIAGPTFGEQGQGATPIVRSEPKYPIHAARDGIEGWVQLSFAISTSGEVIDINVIDAEPKRTFDRAAVAALKRWKYRPKIENGQAVIQNNQSVVLEFKLAQ